MTINQTYKGKRVLITGTTGFLGKVLLEKFLFSLDCVDRFYVLIRPKAGSNLQERFQKEVISSPCFDRLRQKHKNDFARFISEKVQPIEGDLQKEGLGLSNKTFSELVEHCHIVINCAASIDFNAPLNEAIDSNIRGSLRMLELARRIKNLNIFTHISTCYVNCDRRGEISEDIVDKGDPQKELSQLLAMPKGQLLANTKKIIGDYPNTYTYTKSLCQRLMKTRQNTVPVCIVRPAIINASYAEPFAGWIDSLAAAAAVYLFVGLGVIRTLKGGPKNIADIVPVDVVVASIIVATAFNIGNKSLPIYHVGSSDLNPIRWSEVRDQVVSFWRKNPTKSQVERPNLLVSTKDVQLKIRKMQHNIPFQFYERLGPLLGKQAQRNIQRMKRVMQRGDEVANLFEFFMMNEWIYECRKLGPLKSFMSAQERKQFVIDVSEIDAYQYVRISNFGIQKYIVKENAELSSNLISQTPQNGYFSDMRWAFNVSFNRQTKAQKAKTILLKSASVLDVIEIETQKRVEAGMEEKKASQIIRKEAERIIDELMGEVKASVVRTMAWSVHKAFKNLFQKISLNTEELQQLREIEKNSSIPIVLLPTHRSYLDLLIVSYVFLIYKLRLPNFVADETLLQAQLLPYLLRASGAFFFKRLLYAKSPLYRSLFDAYLQHLLSEGNTIQFFLQPSRSRSGKILTPTFEILRVLLDAVLSGKANNACLVPLTVNYDKIIEGESFSGELLGEQKEAESLLRLLKAAPYTPRNHGRVYVHLCKPIMARQFIERFHEAEGKQRRLELSALQVQLGKEIVGRMTRGTVITSTALVSAVLLMHRRGISEDELVRFVNTLVKYILKKGYLIGGVNQYSSAVAVNQAISLLAGITSKSKNSIFELTISAGDGLQKILMLSYYRNTLAHAFLPQAFVGCALAALGDQLSAKEGIMMERVHEQTRFLMRILRKDFFITNPLNSSEDFGKVIREMADDCIIQLKDERLTVLPSGQRIVSFYCSLLRAHIDCHWASAVFALSIARNHAGRFEAASLSKFFGTVQWFMESLFEEKLIEDYEACSLECIRSAFQEFEEAKLIRIVAGGKKKTSAVQVLASIPQMEDVESKIKLFRKNIYSSVFSPLQAAKLTLQETPKL